MEELGKSCSESADQLRRTPLHRTSLARKAMIRSDKLEPRHRDHGMQKSHKHHTTARYKGPSATSYLRSYLPVAFLIYLEPLPRHSTRVISMSVPLTFGCDTSCATAQRQVDPLRPASRGGTTSMPRPLMTRTRARSGDGSLGCPCRAASMSEVSVKSPLCTTTKSPKRPLAGCPSLLVLRQRSIGAKMKHL